MPETEAGPIGAQEISVEGKHQIRMHEGGLLPSRYVDLAHHTHRIKQVQCFVLDEIIADMEVCVFGSTLSQMYSLGWP